MVWHCCIAKGTIYLRELLRPMNDKIVHILLIDDDEDDFVITKDLLEEIDQKRYTLDWAINFREGLDKLFSQNYDVCLIDVSYMKDM